MNEANKEAVEIVIIWIEILKGGIVITVAGDERARPSGDTGINTRPFREATVTGGLIRAGITSAADAKPVVGGLSERALTNIGFDLHLGDEELPGDTVDCLGLHGGETEDLSSLTDTFSTGGGDF